MEMWTLEITLVEISEVLPIINSGIMIGRIQIVSRLPVFALYEAIQSSESGILQKRLEF